MLTARVIEQCLKIGTVYGPRQCSAVEQVTQNQPGMRKQVVGEIHDSPIVPKVARCSFQKASTCSHMLRSESGQEMPHDAMLHIWKHRLDRTTVTVVA